MRLSELIQTTGYRRISGADPAITAVVADSRRVVPGSLWVAIRGTRDDGRLHAADAVARGAVAIAAVAGSDLPAGVAAIEVDDERVAIGRLAARFFGEPARAVRFAGITGTNGKTTTAAMLQAIVAATCGDCGLVGTVGIRTGARRLDATMTTPAPEDLHALAAEMRDAGLTHAAMEVSSHALDQRRADAVPFAVAAYTSLGRDHLDYHGDAAAYARAKARLVDLVVPGGTLVLNQDDAFSRGLAGRRDDVRVLRYGRIQAAGCDLTLESVRSTLHGSRFTLRHGDRSAPAQVRFFAPHDLENALAAAGCALGFGLDLEEAARGLEAFQPVAGRMQRVDVGAPFTALVDFMHTPDAFEKALSGLRPLVQNRLIVVFGCGGEKDRGKRGEMGRLAEALADRVLITADNPRGEELDRIQQDVLRGMTQPSAALRLDDRRAAIGAALDAAEAGDVVLIAGKGHERLQIGAAYAEAWDDAEEVRGWAARRGAPVEGASS